MEAQSTSMARSCTTCVKAKAKCVRRADENVCERCTRLKRECHMREPVLRKKKPPIKATLTKKLTIIRRTAQLEKLENKIESLVNALAGAQSNATQQTDYGHLSPPTSHTSPVEGQRNISAEIISTLCPLPSRSQPSTDTPGDNANKEPSLGRALLEPRQEITVAEAEHLLDRYQRLMAPGFPFVVVPQGATARSLFERKPVLLRAITTVAMFHDLPRQEALVNDFIREIAERVMIKTQKSLDILQGMLVFMSWYYPHVFWSSHANNILHLAVAQAVDLGIDRPPQLSPDFKSVTARAVHGPSLISRVPNLDEHRALLGVFCLISMFFCCLKRLEPMAPSKYMNECANTLSEAAEYESDAMLVQLYRMQSINYYIHTATSPSAPMNIYIRAFMADIEKARNANPCRGDNVMLQLHDLATETSAWALSLNELHDNRSRPLSEHLDDLYRCIAAGKAFMNVMFSIPTSVYLTLPFSVFGYFAQVLIILIKLASLEVDGWDVRTVIQELGFLQICDVAAQRFEEVSTTTPDGIAINNIALNKWGGQVRWMKQVYLAKFAHEAGLLPTQTIPRSEEVMPKDTNFASTEAGSVQQYPADELMSADLLSLMDENFWTGFIPDFDFGYVESQGA